MQSNSHEDANKREQTPQSVSGMSHQSDFEMDQDQIDQWAVFQHEAEEERINSRKEPAQPGRNQRDTEDDDRDRTPTSQQHDQSQYTEEQTSNHVDIVVAGIGGAGMNAVNRMINTRVRGVRFVALNTDIQVLSRSEAVRPYLPGSTIHKRPGCGRKCSNRSKGSD